MTALPRCCLKVDVDTHDGMRDGVPRLLDQFRRLGVRATFFLSFGPDNAGKAVVNLIRSPSFLRKMVKTGAPSLYGWRTILSGTLLPARPIAAAMPDLVRRIEAEGHEVGVHAWDHRLWQDHLERLSSDRIREQIELACDAYERILSRPTRAMAAPAWFATPESLRLQDERGLLYASDMRGGAPAYPRLQGYASTTLQLPSTQPCLEELLCEGIRDPARWVEGVLVEPSEPVPALILSLHAEVEGGPYGGFLEALLFRLRETHRICPLEELAEEVSSGTPPLREAALAALPGRSGRVFTFPEGGAR